MSLIIDYPWYFILFCLVAGAAYALLLYWLRRKDGLDRRLRIVLSLLRGVAVAAITFLLLSPLVRRESSRKEKPIIVLAEDKSKSLDYCKDSAFYHDGFLKDLERLETELSKDFEVQRVDYGGSETDMSQMLKDVGEKYWHRNVGAVVVSGDGIYNRGSNPLASAAELAVPVYTIAMGDTTERRDATIADLKFNRIAYLGNQFPMEITMGAYRLKGERAVMSVSCDGRKLFSKQIEITDDHFTAVETVVLDADREGLRNYVVEIGALRDEVTLRNNRRVVPIEVIDGHQKVAIVAAAPHPDVAALRRSIENNQNYEVESFLAKDFKGKEKDYNLLVLHQLPSKIADAGVDVSAMMKSGVPILFVLGSQTDLGRFNTLHAGLEVYSRIERQNEVQALHNMDFTFFALSDGVPSAIEHFPPLVSPFGEYKLSGNAQTLFVAKIGSVNSRLPLVAVTQQGESRYAFIAGEGLWRWRLADWQASQSHDHFNELVDKLVTFTALRVSNKKFHVDVKSVFGENEHVVMTAQLYDDNYEAVNTPEVELAVTPKSGGEKSSYTFNRSGSGYTINLGTLEGGEYSYTATTRFNGKSYSASGIFIVENAELEAMNLVADHSLLATMAATTGGEMVEAHETAKLAELLKSRDDMKTVIYSETRYSDMLNLPIIFILIVLLLAVEWVTRKYNGEV